MLRNIFFHKNMVGENSPPPRFLKEKCRPAKSGEKWENGASEIGIILVTRTKFNINHGYTWSKLLSKVLRACNQCQESIDFRRNRSNWVWHKSVSSRRIQEIVPRTLSPKIRKYLEEKFSARQNQRHLLLKRK